MFCLGSEVIGEGVNLLRLFPRDKGTGFAL